MMYDALRTHKLFFILVQYPTHKSKTRGCRTLKYLKKSFNFSIPLYHHFALKNIDLGQRLQIAGKQKKFKLPFPIHVIFLNCHPMKKD